MGDENFRSWFQVWKVRLNATSKVLKNLEDFYKLESNYCLKYFVMEIRNEKGEFYSPRTLKEILSMIQYYFQSSLQREWSTFDDKEFRESSNILDAQIETASCKGNSER